MNDAGIEVSLFIAPDEKQIEASARTGCQFIELHTGRFAGGISGWSRVHGREPRARLPLDPRPSAELQRLIAGAKQAHALGLKVNAGHGLNYV